MGFRESNSACQIMSLLSMLTIALARRTWYLSVYTSSFVSHLDSVNPSFYLTHHIPIFITAKKDECECFNCLLPKFKCAQVRVISWNRLAPLSMLQDASADESISSYPHDSMESVISLMGSASAPLVGVVSTA